MNDMDIIHNERVFMETTATDTRQIEAETEVFTEPIRIPSKETQEAIDELESGRGKRFNDLESMYRWLHEDA